MAVNIKEGDVSCLFDEEIPSGALKAPIAQAKALVEGEIGGSVDKRTETLRVPLLYDLGVDQRMLLTRGPLVTVNSMVFNSETASIDVSELSVASWSLGRVSGVDLTKSFAKGLWTIGADLGWHYNDEAAGPDDLPDEVKQAIVHVASEIYESPTGGALKSERIGDWSYTLAGDDGSESTALSKRAMKLLTRYRQPRV